MRWKLEHILKINGGSILFEDDTLIVVNKPSGLLVLPDRFDRNLVNLYELLKEAFGSIFIVHRIDRETSGVVLFAKTPDMHAHLNTAFEQREVEKKYHAIVAGCPTVDSGHIDLPISESDRGTRKMKVDKKNGKQAMTDFKVIERYNGYAFVEARPHTGRTHQIRIHLSAFGMPILADPLYGNGTWFYLSSVKRNYKSKEEEKPLLARTALHAFSLSFMNPTTHSKILMEAPMPKDMSTVLKVLTRYREK